MNVDALRSEFQGAILTPDSPSPRQPDDCGNGMIDRRPPLSRVHQCGRRRRCRALRGAREPAPGCSLRGHNVAGLASLDDGLVIDVSQMKQDRRRSAMDGCRRGGAHWGEFDLATRAHGLGDNRRPRVTTGIAASRSECVGGSWVAADSRCDNTLAYNRDRDGQQITATADAHADHFGR